MNIQNPVRLVPVTHIDFNVNIDSRSAGERNKEIDQLAASIRSLGLINPISVMDNGDDTYRLVDGRRRLAAFMKVLISAEN